MQNVAALVPTMSRRFHRRTRRDGSATHAQIADAQMLGIKMLPSGETNTFIMMDQMDPELVNVRAGNRSIGWLTPTMNPTRAKNGAAGFWDIYEQAPARVEYGVPDSFPADLFPADLDRNRGFISNMRWPNVVPSCAVLRA